MECRFDILCAASAQNPASIREDAALWAMWQSLLSYYEDGTWLEDYMRDERGELPANLKRGVLSEDGVYNLLSDVQQSHTEIREEVMKRPCGRYTGRDGQAEGEDGGAC